MALSGWYGPGNFTSVASAPYDDVGWSGSGTTFRYDDNVVGGVTIPNPPGSYSHILRTFAFAFSGIIPNPSTINGIELRINIYCPVSPTDSRTSFVRLHNNGSVLGTSKGVNVNIATSANNMVSYGSNIDLWGNGSLSRATVTAATFGVELALQAPTSGGIPVFIDSIEMQIDYTYTGGGGGGGQYGKSTNHLRQQKASISGFIGGR